jgi:hypothetical protein
VGFTTFNSLAFISELLLFFELSKNRAKQGRPGKNLGPVRNFKLVYYTGKIEKKLFNVNFSSPKNGTDLILVF